MNSTSFNQSIKRTRFDKEIHPYLYPTTKLFYNQVITRKPQTKITNQNNFTVQYLLLRRLTTHYSINSLQNLYVNQVYQFCAFLIGRWLYKVLERLELIYLSRAQSVHRYYYTIDCEGKLKMSFLPIFSIQQ